MKKRIISIISIIMLTLLMAVSLAACTEIFKVNRDKDGETPYLTIRYDGYEKVVKKKDFVPIFSAAAAQYLKQGKTFNEALDATIEQIVEKYVRVFKARAYVAEKLKKDKYSNIEDLLTTSEIDRAVKETNKQFETQLARLVKSEIDDDKKNNEENEPRPNPKAKKYIVRFDYGKGKKDKDAPEKTEVAENSKVKRPKDPTYDGYKIHGWKKKGTDELFDFDKNRITSDITLEAYYEPYEKPRTQIPDINPNYKNESKAYDPDKEIPESEITKKFFDLLNAGEYDCVDKKGKMLTGTGRDKLKFNEVKWFYEVDGIKKYKFFETAKKTIKTRLGAKGNGQASDNAKIDREYDRFYQEQLETVLVAKRGRYIEKLIKAGVKEEEVENEYNVNVEIQRKQLDALTQNDTDMYASENSERLKKYQSYFKEKNNTALYHKGYADKSSGFVINILFKLSKEQTKKLVDMANNGASKEAIENERNKMLKEKKVRISNPMYKKNTAVLKKDDGSLMLEDETATEGSPVYDISKIVDPMTDKNFKYNKKDSYYNKKNDYKKLVSLGKDDKGNYEIKFGAKEAANMPYCLGEVDLYGDDGILKQIYNSLDEVDKNDELSQNQKLYWKHKIATAWLHMVGDDEGSTSSSSNNGGLGYFVQGDGKGQFIPEFTAHARELIKRGSGTYSSDGSYEKSYIVADSFSDSKDTAQIKESSAYAGVFFLYNSRTVWDENIYGIKKNSDGEVEKDEHKKTVTESLTYNKDSGVLPSHFIYQNHYRDKNAVSIYDRMFESVLASRYEKQKKEDTEDIKQSSKNAGKISSSTKRKIRKLYKQK